jgi:hypothetical protein
MVVKVVNKDLLIGRSLTKTLNVYLVRKKMSKQLRKNKVKEALASLKVDGIEVSDYCRSQLNEYINGRMTAKMMLRMLDEWYIEEVVKDRLGGKTIKVNIEEKK